MCFLRPHTTSVSKQHQLRMGAVQHRIKRLSLRRPESVFSLFTLLLVGSVAHSAALSASTSLDADGTLSDGSHHATSLSASRLHRSRHCSSVLRPPTRPLEKRAKSSSAAERLWTLARTRTAQLLPNLSYSSEILVLRESVTPVHGFRQGSILSMPVTCFDWFL